MSGAAGSRGPEEAGVAVPASRVFVQAAHRVLATGLILCAVGLGAGYVAAGEAWTGAAWGAGAGIALTCLTAVSLRIPWDRFPLLASSGVMLSFAAKIAVMVTVVILARPYRESMSPRWFFATFAVALLAVTVVEIVTLVKGKTLTAE